MLRFTMCGMVSNVDNRVRPSTTAVRMIVLSNLTLSMLLRSCKRHFTVSFLASLHRFWLSRSTPAVELLVIPKRV